MKAPTLLLPLSFLCAVAHAAEMPPVQAQALPQAVERRLAESEQPVKLWVFFKDKGLNSLQERSAAYAELEATYPKRAQTRRALRREGYGLFDFSDLPVASTYISGVSQTGARVLVTSTWLNAVSVLADADQARRIAQLEGVESLRPVAKSAPLTAMTPRPAPKGAAGFYGSTEAQLNQINLTGLHQKGFTGAGVVIGVLDSGFRLDHDALNLPGHTINVLASWDFVDNDANVGPEAGDASGQSDHGTMVLSTIAGYLPNTFVGAAYDASFVLAKTEDIASETPVEEDNYVAGLQFIEAQGADVATSSLGYIDWYVQGQLDGLTAVTTKAVNIATQNGLICCTAAGNSGNDADPATSHLIAPADAFDVLTCGAVDSTNALVFFSSDGATADGRTKPELLALGLDTSAISPFDTTGFVTVSGTSLATPLLAGAVACLVEAHPTWTVGSMRTQLFQTATSIGLTQPDPLFGAGYGMVNALGADEHLDLGHLTPGTGGSTSSLAITGALPSSVVWLTWGIAPGSVQIPGCAPITIDITAPHIYGTMATDLSGQANFLIPIPTGVAGLVIYMQIAELASCRASNLEISTLQ